MQCPGVKCSEFRVVGYCTGVLRNGAQKLAKCCHVWEEKASAFARIAGDGLRKRGDSRWGFGFREQRRTRLCTLHPDHTYSTRPQTMTTPALQTLKDGRRAIYLCGIA